MSSGGAGADKNVLLCFVLFSFLCLFVCLYLGTIQVTIGAFG